MPEKIYEKEYKSVMARIGGTMLIFLLLFNTLFPIAALIEQMLIMYMDAGNAYIVGSLIQSVAYLATFLIPCAFFGLISKKHQARPVFNDIRLGRQFPLMLIASIAITLAVAYVNSFIVEIFNFSSFYEQYMQVEPLDKNYKLVLEIIATALVPACCEEYLFRGVILTNVLPYGKTPAIIISAVLFGLMHQNPAQILYTTIAGIVIGLVYVRTRSIWGGVLIHFFNNLFSVLEQLLTDRLEYEQATKICIAMEAVLFVGGVICAIVLIMTERRRKRMFSDSGFGVVLEPSEEYVEYPLKQGRAAKLFFSPAVIIFICIVCIQMLYYILLALGVVRL
ncbi:MAG: CPBP family intramembrane metalloprotease [Clostridia bacterium]|nr:CPBP family intramembrane metalloprotease [Clostridia bacterium]